MTNIAEITKSQQSSIPTTEIGYDGRSGVAATVATPLGIAHRPKVGALCLMSPILGNDANSFLHVVQDTKGVPELQPNESAVGNFEAGCYMHFKNDGTVLIIAKTLIIQADIQQTGNTAQTGGIKTTQDIVAGSISLESHTHGGVQSGGGSTGAPN